MAWAGDPLGAAQLRRHGHESESPDSETVSDGGGAREILQDELVVRILAQPESRLPRRARRRPPPTLGQGLGLVTPTLCRHGDCGSTQAERRSGQWRKRESVTPAVTTTLPSTRPAFHVAAGRHDHAGRRPGARSRRLRGKLGSPAGGTGPPGSATWGCRGRSRPQNRRVRTISESSAAVSTEIQVMVRAMRTAGPAAAEPRPESHQSRAAAAANVHGVASARW